MEVKGSEAQGRHREVGSRGSVEQRYGLMDKRFLEGCPWITVKVGAAMIPDERSVKHYLDAVLDYAEVLLGGSISASPRNQLNLAPEALHRTALRFRQNC